MQPDLKPILDPHAVRSVIMVVEDEVLVRLMTVDMLLDAGFEVVEVCNADEALALLATDVAPDLIFTDVNMPGSIDGLALTAYIKDVHPRIPVIVTSGGVPAHRLIAANPAATVLKPYTETTLLDAIDQVLKARRG